METTKDFLKYDQFETEHQHNLDAAREACISEAGDIIMEVEHMVDEVSLEVPLRHVPELAEAIKKVANLRFFEFSAQVEGKYRVYEEDFDYDFTTEIREFLSDSLGYELILEGEDK